MATAPQSTSEAWQLYWATRSTEARNSLCLLYVALLRQVAISVRKSLEHPVDLDDLISDGVFGLFEAIDTFDPARGKFESWAWMKIGGAMLNGMREYDQLARLRRLTPTKRARALATFGGDPEKRPNNETDPAATAELHDLAEVALSSLTNRERSVIRRKYWAGISLTRIGRMPDIGSVTPARMVQIHKAALAKIRRRLRVLERAA